MEQYADHPMDLADASLLVAAEVLPTHRIFTIDRRTLPPIARGAGIVLNLFRCCPDELWSLSSH
jgi:hypothetical protein